MLECVNKTEEVSTAIVDDYDVSRASYGMNTVDHRYDHILFSMSEKWGNGPLSLAARNAIPYLSDPCAFFDSASMSFSRAGYSEGEQPELWRLPQVPAPRGSRSEWGRAS